MQKPIENPLAIGWLVLMSPSFLAVISVVGSELGLSINDALDVLTPKELGNFVLSRLGVANGRTFAAGLDPQQDKFLEEFFG